MADGLVKRGEIYHFDFVFNGKRHQGSTRLKNKAKALEVVRKIRTDLALGEHGIGPKKASPLFKDFMEKQFLDFVGRHAKAKNTREFYRKRTAQLLKFPGFKDKRLSEIDGEVIEKYSTWRKGTRIEKGASAIATGQVGFMIRKDVATLAKSVTVNTLNGELKTLRKALKLAEEWGLLKKAPKVRQLPGGKGRDFVVSPALEKLYLEKATYPLKQVAILILDCGFRPEECTSLRKSQIANDTVTVLHGKTSNAHRTIPLTQRARTEIELCCALFPDSPFLFPGKRAGTHLTRGSADDLHAALRVKLEVLAAASSEAGIGASGVHVDGMPANAKDFVLHGFRHTYGTRLAESGAREFEIKYLMGHSSIKMSEKYIHFSESSVTLAAKRKELYDKMIRGEDVQDLASESEKLNTS